MRHIFQSIRLSSSPKLTRASAVVVFTLLAAEPMFSQTDVARNDVTRTTLDNGLRVVIIRS
jgi:hypothetical protein